MPKYPHRIDAAIVYPPNIYARIAKTAQACCLLMLLGAAGSAAADSENDPKPLNCLPINQIRTTKIVDDRTILFKTNHNLWYKNTLPHKCPGLKSNDKFSYKTSLSQLCDLDIIAVLVSAGGDINRGASCGLGKFVPTDAPSKANKADRKPE